jgi:hypothetical protein
VKKGMGWAMLGLLVFYVVTRPGDAAGAVRTIGGGIVSIANGVSAFLANLI